MEPKNESMLRAGAAQIDITPLPGIPLTGFLFRLGPSTGIHDRLYARSLVLDTGAQRAVIISCDLLALDGSFVTAVRQDIRAATGIPESSIMISCSHTHSGPATVFLRDCGEVDPVYLQVLRKNLLKVTQEAISNLVKAQMGTGRGQVSEGVHNRRQPGEQVDPELGVVAFRGEQGQMLAILINYACHPVCLDHTNRLISADYPGFLAGELHKRTGAVVLFTNGAAGDINPQQMGDFSYAEAIGKALASETIHVLAYLSYSDSVTFHFANQMLELPLNPASSIDELTALIAQHQKMLLQVEADVDVLQSKHHRAMLGWAETTLTGASQKNLPTSIPAELQVFCLGPLVLVGVPGEIFNALGMQIKKFDTERQVLVLSYTNNDIGYIPTHQAYALGGYEIDDAFKFYGYPSVLSPSAGDLLLEIAAKMIKGCPGIMQ
jgi:neutral ceramidase